MEGPVGKERERELKGRGGSERRERGRAGDRKKRVGMYRRGRGSGPFEKFVGLRPCISHIAYRNIEGLNENIPQLKVYFSYRPPYWVLYRWCNVFCATVVLLEFIYPGLLYRIIWMPMTRHTRFKLLQFSACIAATILQYINFPLGCLATLAILYHNNQLAPITGMLACWSVTHKQIHLDSLHIIARSLARLAVTATTKDH